MSIQKVFIQFELEDLKQAIREVLLEGQSVSSNVKSGEERLLSRKETAARLGICLPKLDDLVKENSLPAVRLGKRIRFKESEIISSLKPVQVNKFKRA